MCHRLTAETVTQLLLIDQPQTQFSTTITPVPASAVAPCCYRGCSILSFFFFFLSSFSFRPIPLLTVFDKYSGVRQLVVDIRSRPDKYVLATRLFCCSLPSANITMSAHVTATIRTCFAALRQIRNVRRSLMQDALLTLICSLAITKLHFCCSVLTGVSGSLMQRLQSMLNAAARLVFSARRSEHTTPLLRELHWLKVRREFSTGCVF